MSSPSAHPPSAYQGRLRVSAGVAWSSTHARRGQGGPRALRRRTTSTTAAATIEKMDTCPRGTEHLLMPDRHHGGSEEMTHVSRSE